MYGDNMSEKITWPSRMSLPLTEEDRRKIILLKADLQMEKLTLRDFVMQAIWEKHAAWEKQKREKGQRK
jgi:hypothetical protein